MKTINNQKPFISVLMATFNAGKYLRPAVESILNQTYTNFEFIIIDDGSTDNSIHSIADISDSRIRIIEQKNWGRPVALNRGLKEISGEFYVIQDADDLSYPTRIERLVKAMTENAQLAGVFSGYDLIIDGDRFAPRFRHKSVEECRADIDKMAMPSHDPTSMFRVSSVKNVIYEPSLVVGAGWDYILRIGEKLPLMVVGDCLYSYRINRYSNTRSDSDRRLQKVQAVLKRAYARRDQNYTPREKKTVSAEESHYGVVPHFMESVLDLRRSGEAGMALKTAFQCIRLRPMKMAYYKPFVYAITPLAIIQKYRQRKNNSMLLRNSSGKSPAIKEHREAPEIGDKTQ